MADVCLRSVLGIKNTRVTGRAHAALSGLVHERFLTQGSRRWAALLPSSRALHASIDSNTSLFCFFVATLKL